MSNVSAKNIILSQSKIGIQNEGNLGVLTHRTTVEEDRIIINIEVPGVDPQEIAVHCDSTLLYVECPRGQTSISIDPGLDTGEINADVKWGLLTLQIPRRASRAVKVHIHDFIEKKAASAKVSTTKIVFEKED
jgi:hypothetical protein